MSGFRIDETGFGDIRIIQEKKGFCYGIDAVIIADFLSKHINAEYICDLGTGNGIIPLILSEITRAKKILGIDNQRSSIKLAMQSVTLNKLENKISFSCRDVKDMTYDDLLDDENVDMDIKMQREFDAVICNPPYFPKGRAIVNPDNKIATARHETTATLNDFMETAKRLLKTRGCLYMINRPSRLGDAISAGRETGMEPRRIRMVTSRWDTEPKMVLMEFVKDGGKEFIVEKNLVIYDETGEYTDEIEKIYRRK